MYRINFTTLSLLLVLGMNGLMSEPTKNADGSIKGLYEYLLQREYAAPVSYADHQIKRKAVRSPSLRLRFGRRSDPDMPVQPEEEDSMPPARTIRAPQLRLRFGRSDPLWSSSADRAAAAAAFLEDKRAPSQRIRWGRSQLGTFNENALREAVLARGDDLNRDPTLRLRWGRESGEDDEFDSDSDNVADRLYREATGMDRFAEDKRAPSQRLRWGRSDPLLSNYNSMQEEKRAPSQRLRWGRSDPMLSNDDTFLDEEKRAPSQRLRWGRSGGMFPTSDVMQQKTIRAPQLRLRFGRSDPSWASFNEHRPDGENEATVSTERAVDSEEHSAASEETGSSNMDEK
uniref:Short neuropeptide F n=1 Tax=Culex pipiens TaxID=7175 RepID=A0A8D8NLR4_CULPI